MNDLTKIQGSGMSPMINLSTCLVLQLTHFITLQTWWGISFYHIEYFLYDMTKNFWSLNYSDKEIYQKIK